MSKLQQLLDEYGRKRKVNLILTTAQRKGVSLAKAQALVEGIGKSIRGSKSSFIIATTFLVIALFFLLTR